VVGYDAHEMARAFDDLDELYAAGEGGRHEATLRMVRAVYQAHNERRWDHLRALYADDLVVVDHRPAGFGELHGADEMLARHRAMVDVAPDYRVNNSRYLAFSERAVFAQTASIFHGKGGGAYDLGRLLVSTLRTPHGPVDRVEYFDAGQLELAWERFHALTGPTRADDNLAMVMSRRWFPALVEGDWDTVAGLLAPSFVLEDRRPMFASRFDGPEAAMEWFRATASLGLGGVDLEPIATRGDHIAVLRRSWLASDYEMTSLCLVEVDEEGRAAFAVLWDGDEVDAALAELDERFLAG
jgi:hypothetical protein